MDFFQGGFLAFYFLWFAWIANEDRLHGEVYNWKLWFLVAVGILYSFVFSIQVSIAFNIMIAIILLMLGYIGKLPFADLVAFGSISSFFPDYFFLIVGASMLAGLIYMKVKRVSVVHFIPFIFSCLIGTIVFKKFF